ncbi:reverse transcriptase domain-containing protein [Tanacetum coccineum]
MEDQYVKFLDMIRVVRINVPLVDVFAGMPNYGKFLKELMSNKHKIKQISAAFLSDESSAILQNKVPPKLGNPGSFLIPCNFNKVFSCNALADLGASINLMSIAENMLVEVGKFTFRADFIILEMEEDSKVPLILGRPFLHTVDAVIRVKQNIDVIDEILEEDFDALLEKGSEILHSIEGTILEEKLFSEFDEFMAMTADENSKSESDTKEPPFEKITFNTSYKIKTSFEEPLTDLEKIIDILGICIIYPIADSPWVSPIHCVPKKGGITVVTNEKYELVPTRTVIGWRVCIDYHKLNEATVKDHFPLPFMDQMLERLAGNKYFCFLKGFSRYFQIPIDPMDQEKTMFTCPFGTYAYRRMHFGLCNAPATLQRRMLAIFRDMIEESIKVFMDDFSVLETLLISV